MLYGNIRIKIKTFTMACTALCTAMLVNTNVTAQEERPADMPSVNDKNSPIRGKPAADTPGGQGVHSKPYGNSPLNANVDVSQNSQQPASIEPAREDDTITVTGSHIKGLDNAIGTQLITIDRQEIEKAGFSDTRDIFQSLPQNFGGGATGEFQANLDSADNRGLGTTVNLRGLGSLATLVLINGRRLPAAGERGSAVDISVIPLAAIERIEVLPDGASAV